MFFAGLMLGICITGVADAILFYVKYLRTHFWNNPKTFFGFHFHHSLVGVVCLLVAIILYFASISYSSLLWGIGLGIIIVHTVTDGRIVFIERKKTDHS